MIRVRVPATSANMGAGFDSMGIALGMYNTLDISKIPSGLEVINLNSRDYIPRDASNLVYRSMQMVFDKVNYKAGGLKIVQNSQIPVTRGLGSSSACIIGGMLAANVLSGRQLSYHDILDLSVQLEGHPDNVTPALFGGFCVSAMDNGKTVFNSSKLKSSLKFAVMIPNFFVATKKSRGALPEAVTHRDAVFNVSRAALFASSMISGNIDNLKTAVQDKLHQPYRSNYIDGMDEIFEKTYELGARATYLSGSGPTILSILDGGYNPFRVGMHNFFRQTSRKWNCYILSIDNVGAVVREL